MFFTSFIFYHLFKIVWLDHPNQVFKNNINNLMTKRQDIYKYILKLQIAKGSIDTCD